MPEVIFETNSDIYTVDWGKYGTTGDYHDHVNYDGDSKHIYTFVADSGWRDIRFGIDLAGFDHTDKSINLIKVQFRCFGEIGTKAKALLRCGSEGSPPWFTDYGSEQSLSWTAMDFEQTWVLNPCVSKEWQWEDIEELYIGLSGKQHMGFEWFSPYCSRLKLLVDYNDWLTPPLEMSGFFL